MRDVSWVDIFKLCASTTASEFCEWVSLTHLHGFQLLAINYRNHFFRLYQQNKSESKVKFRQASNLCKGFLKLPNLHMLKESITSQKLGSWDFWQITKSVLNNGISAIPLLFNGLDMLSSDKAKLFANNFSNNSNLDDSSISLPVFPSRTNLSLHNISVTRNMVKNVVRNLDSKASDPYCILVVVLKNYILNLHTYLLNSSVSV